MAVNLTQQQKGSAPVELWVRAGSDGVRNGGDPVCQQVFMMLFVKAHNPDSGLSFNVKTVNPAKPHSEFRDAGLRHTPGIVHGEAMIEHPDDIIEFVDSTFPHPPMQYFDPDADAATRNLFSKFCFFIKEVNKDPTGLEAELRKFDTHVVEMESKYLTGNAMTHLDCRIMPYLQHIRIATQGLKGYSIPESLTGVWSYMSLMYQTEAFVKTCPSDQEILLYWAERKDTPNLPPSKTAELARQSPAYTWNVPNKMSSKA